MWQPARAGQLDRIFGRVVSVSEPAVPVDANVVRPKIDKFLLSEFERQNNPAAHDFLIRRGDHGGPMESSESYCRAVAD
ncbi:MULTISPECIES: hypothetical protein [Bradyrhizobium]|uniref:hypothetical protein n=1 Tax=Bradyrhizobium TaxID=374 RepID=UPI00211EBF62|nr:MULTISPECIES: hypothetical protein [Bradyrhizobium]